jgi:hypothetical protein
MEMHDVPSGLIWRWMAGDAYSVGVVGRKLFVLFSSVARLGRSAKAFASF